MSDYVSSRSLTWATVILIVLAVLALLRGCSAIPTPVRSGSASPAYSPPQTSSLRSSAGQPPVQAPSSIGLPSTPPPPIVQPSAEVDVDLDILLPDL